MPRGWHQVEEQGQGTTFSSRKSMDACQWKLWTDGPRDRGKFTTPESLTYYHIIHWFSPTFSVCHSAKLANMYVKIQVRTPKGPSNRCLTMSTWYCTIWLTGITPTVRDYFPTPRPVMPNLRIGTSIWVQKSWAFGCKWRNMKLGRMWKEWNVSLFIFYHFEWQRLK